ncbi:hypothetical protein MWU52_05955 [Jannaschia sp. S6380]|uniref:hypothetical protein n=1 Tax=Jannaschia sp. S6380 TaxID=2926408 RepID=UPI001FF342B3|nr:hypothetical protein [Jannaschia sp. S6380]MCK0167088.1 hypothetical protein [Jannaschia sp. S6380]
MLHRDDFGRATGTALVDANDMLRRMLRAQGDDGLSPRRIDFGFRRARLFASKPADLAAKIEELGLTKLPASVTTGAEGDLVMTIEASPYAADFDRLDAVLTDLAAGCGWRNEGWSSVVRETI